MELDQLKEMWGNVGAKQNSTSEEELQTLLRKKSKSPITKMKRNLFVELLAIAVLYIFAILHYFLQYSGGMRLNAWLLVVIGVLYLFYYQRKLKLLNSMECVACEVKSNLKTQLKTLEKYIRFYLLAGTALFPFAMIVTGFIVFFNAPEISKGATVPSGSDAKIFAVLLVLISAVLTVPMYFLNKWYVRKLYGQHVERLKAIVEEMNED